MDYRALLVLAIVGWIVSLIAAVRVQWSPKTESSGLLTAYLFNLALIHLLGALIYSFPWYSPQSLYLIAAGSTLPMVTAGFLQSTYGLTGLFVGSFVVAPKLLEMFAETKPREVPYLSSVSVARAYMILGVLSYFVLQPLLGSIPSVSAIVSSGLMIFVAGACLGSWHSKQEGGLRLFMGLACALPLVTILTQGFISFGARAASIILIFIFGFYRPRWRVLVAASIAIVLGLSMFVTYLRDRGLIRDVIWHGYENETKLERLYTTVRNFEIINFRSQQHLEAIDVRLNQNLIVGQAVYFVPLGKDFARGTTLLEAITAWIPRIIWPDKPYSAGGNGMVSLYAGRRFSAGTSWGPGPIFEFYINFGSVGVVLGMLLYGILLRIVDFVSGWKLRSGNGLGFISWFLPGIALINPGGTIAEVVAQGASSVVLVVLFNRFLLLVSPDSQLGLCPQDFERPAGSGSFNG